METGPVSDPEELRCFLPDTPVLAADGSVLAMRSVAPGQMIMAFTEGGELVEDRVVARHHSTAKLFFELEDGTISTPDHPFLNEQGGFEAIASIAKRSGSIVTSDGQLKNARGTLIAFRDGIKTPLETDEVDTESFDTREICNLTIAKNKTYVANDNRVHNTSFLDLFPTTPKMAVKLEAYDENGNRLEEYDLYYGVSINDDGSVWKIGATGQDLDGDRNTDIIVREIRDVNGNIIRHSADLEKYQQSGVLEYSGTVQGPFRVAPFAATIGSSVGRFLAGDNPVLGVVSSAAFRTIALNIGQYIDAQRQVDLVSQISLATDGFFGDFGPELVQSFASSTVGTVSSFLALELGHTLGLEGFGAELFQTASSTVLSTVVFNALDPAKGLFDGLIGNVIEPSVVEGLGGTIDASTAGQSIGALEASIGSFLGAKLGSLVIQPTTQAGSILSSIGASIGSFAFGVGAGSAGAIGLFATTLNVTLTKVFGQLANVIVPGIGAFIGFILGAFIGKLFGKKPDPVIPRANAEVMLDFDTGYFDVGDVQSRDGGNERLIRNIAESARDTLNGLIGVVVGDARVAPNANLDHVRQIYGHRADQLWVKTGNSSTRHNVATADEAVDYGVLWGIERTKIVGGGLYLKRAIARSNADSVIGLAGDLQIAEDYLFYLNNREFINDMIADAWSTLPASEQTFYTDNADRFARIMAQDEVTLDPTDASWYTANQARVDAIITSLSVTQFAASWLVTLQRASELGLDRAAPSDFFGGMRGFADSLSTIVGGNLGYEDFALRMTGADLEVVRDANRDGIADTGEEILITQTDFGSNIGFNTNLTVTSGTSGHDLRIFSGQSAGVSVSDTYSIYYNPDAFWIAEPDDWLVAGQFSNDSDDIFIGGNGADILRGYAGWDWLDGSAGNDTLYGGVANDVLLGRTGNDTLYGEQDDDYLWGGSGGDKLYGGDGNDILVEGSGSDDLWGDAGDDLFYAFQDQGDDYLFGGTGRDTLSWARDTDGGVDVSLAGTRYGDVRFYEFENLEGSNDSDVLRGDSSANTIRGLDGVDYIYGGGGTGDVLEGGAGADEIRGDGSIGATLSYSLSPGAVWVDLETGSALGADAQGDQFWDIANLQGSDFADTLIGDASANVLTGLRGDDWFIASQGADSLIGGEGFDTADYANWGSAVTINFASNVTATGSGNHTLDSIEHAVGTRYNDTFVGSAEAEAFSGNVGNDWMSGNGGSDIYVINRGGGTDEILDSSGTSDEILFGFGISARHVLPQKVFSHYEMFYHNPFEPDVRTFYDLQLSVVEDGNTASPSSVAVIDVYFHESDSIERISFNDGGWLILDGITSMRRMGTGLTEMFGAANTREWLFGGEGDDVIYGAGSATTFSTHGDIFVGGLGSDTYYGSGGDDQYTFDRAEGRDVISDLGGEDSILFGPGIELTDLTFKVVEASDITEYGLASHLQGDLVFGIRNPSTPDLMPWDLAETIRVDNWGVGTANRVETIIVDGVEFDLANLVRRETGFNTAPIANDQFLYADFFASGGPIGTVSATDPDGDPVSFSITSVSGYGANPSLWSFSGNTLMSTVPWNGTSQAVSTLGVAASDGAGTTNFTVTVYWESYDDLLGFYPIVFDLEGNGYDLVPVDASGTVADVDGDGTVDKVGWVASSDGILTLDRDGNGTVTDLSEISFIDDAPGAQTDLEGLAGHDSNGDGWLTAADEAWEAFSIWRDYDQNGAADASELQSLDQLGMTGLRLTGDPTGQSADQLTDNTVLNTTVWTKADGSMHEAGDIVLAYTPLDSAYAQSWAPGSLVGDNPEAKADLSVANTVDQLSQYPWLMDGADRAGYIESQVQAQAQNELQADVATSEDRGPLDLFNPNMNINASSSAADPAGSPGGRDPVRLLTEQTLAHRDSLKDRIDRFRTRRQTGPAETDAGTGREPGENRLGDFQRALADFSGAGSSNQTWWSHGLVAGRASGQQNRLFSGLDDQETVTQAAGDGTMPGPEGGSIRPDAQSIKADQLFRQALAAFGSDRGAMDERQGVTESGDLRQQDLAQSSLSRWTSASIRRELRA